MPRIRVIDFETTGMEPPAEVCEVGKCDLYLRDGETEWTVNPLPVSYLCGVKSMPAEVRAIHHITLAETEGWAPFMDGVLWSDCDGDSVDVIAAHNAEFEAKFWGSPPLPVICTYKAALRVWPEAPSHSNGALRYWLEDQGLLRLHHETAMPPHRAGPDAYVTAHILKALLSEATARQMAAWTKEPRLLPKCTLGKFRGVPWPEVETGFLTWMLNQATMEVDLKWNAQRELDRRRNVDNPVL